MDESHSLQPTEAPDPGETTPPFSSQVSAISSPSRLSPEDERDTLVITLMYAARRLADRYTRRYGFQQSICEECHSIGSAPDVILHARACNVGAVDAALSALLASYEAGIYRIENAPGGEFGEPWFQDPEDLGTAVNQHGFEVYDAYGTELPEPDEIRYAERIVACVNACAGVSTEALRRSGRTAKTSDLHGVDALFGSRAPEPSLEPFEYPESGGGAQ